MGGGLRENGRDRLAENGDLKDILREGRDGGRGGVAVVDTRCRESGGTEEKV